jgi:hypothetical protein
LTGTTKNWRNLVPPINCAIGAFCTGTGYNWNGNITDVRIYNRALTAAEVANMDLPLPSITSALTATATNGFPFSYQIAANNNPTTFGASGLPAGLSVNTASGVISGTVSTTGSANVTISAVNESGSASATLVITEDQMPAPSITSSTSALATEGRAFSYQITATGNPTSFGQMGLPSGLALNTATGLVSGTAMASGSSNVTLDAINAGGTGTAILALYAQTPYAYWQSQVFTTAELADPSTSGDTADPAGDGIPNLMKYALGLSPWIDGVNGLPVEGSIAISGATYLSLTYTQVISAIDLTYTVQVSTDLENWNSGAGFVAPYGVVTNPGRATQSVTVRTIFPENANTPAQFMRLQVTGP